MSDAARPGRLLCVGGAPGAGKTTVGRLVARAARAALVDLDSVTTPLVDAVAASAGDAADLDAPRYAALRDARYACLADVSADCIAAGVDVVVVAPFTREATGATWSAWGRATGASDVTTCWLDVDPAVVVERVAARGLPRDVAKAGRQPERVVVAPDSVDLLLDTGPAGPEELAARVLAGWSSPS
ncbi:AAA family ATPase [Phycicoccus avicenniae]|uniref:AAA family ATPase n=1 Tax=Phycicoccus avicenniae TaxID=2828860 RepID=UPI003D2DE2FC